MVVQQTYAPLRTCRVFCYRSIIPLLRRGSRRREVKMFTLARMVDFVINVYAVGLLVYVLCTWIVEPRAERLARWLGRFYLPFLTPLQRHIRPTKVGSLTIDFSPWALLAGILLFRGLVVWILAG